MHGVKRVLIFCILIVILPATLIIVPLYLRKTVFADVTYPVAESDIIEIRDGISSIFCQQHSLRMSTHFNAFQLRSRPEISTNHKHIRLKKSMTLPDDTLEYWGFYLLKGAQVHLKFCSRYDGSRILVVKGQRELKTCGLLEHNKNKLDANLAQGHEQVKVFFEDITEIVENDVKHGVANDDMEHENHGGEDIDEDLNGNDVTSVGHNINSRIALDSHTVENQTSTSPTPMESTTKRRRPKEYRKKLKKGTAHHKVDETSSTTTTTTTTTESSIIVDNNSTSIEIMEAAETAASDAQNIRRQRRHQQHQHKHHAEDAANDEAFRERHRIEHERRKQVVYDQLYKPRKKREHVYDRKYSHGGNAVNFTETDESNSISSFENGLFDCYNGAILLAEGFPPSADCLNAHFLENGSHRMLSKHEVSEDGYYYYIFYSDNDLVRNDIHAIFDIYKPTFQYSNLSDSEGCVNATNCTFPIGFLSDEIVVVEVPTRDGIEHEEDDITYLISTCHPRTEVYAIFPITVLLLILGCSFL